MLKLLLALLSLVSLASAQSCPYPSTNVRNGIRTNYCYYAAGFTQTWAEAVILCRNYGMNLNMPKTDAGLADLYKLYLSYGQSFWVGASASPSNPLQFYFVDNNPVFNNIHFCQGEPKGQSNICAAYYSAGPSCFSSIICNPSANLAVLCQATF